MKKKNFWIVAHDGSSMFTSSTHNSGDVWQCASVCGVVEVQASKGWKEEAAVGRKLYFILFLIHSNLIRDLSYKYKIVTLQVSIGWHKTSVLRHSLTQCFLF